MMVPVTTTFLAFLSLLVSPVAATAVFWQARLITLSMRAQTLLDLALLDLDARWRSKQMRRTLTLASRVIIHQT